MIIYMITNEINGKKYIGQTRASIKKRFSQHCERRYGTTISMAIRKYGKDNFKISIIHERVNSQEELNNLEKHYIKKHNTIAPTGYNIEHGGYSPMNQDTKNKISQKLKGRKITWKRKTSDSVKKLWEKEEYREKQALKKKQKRGPYRKGIIKLNLRKNVNIEEFKIDYNSYMRLSEMADKYNISIHTIYQIIKREHIKKRGYKCKKKEV